MINKVSETKLGLGLAALGRPEYINIGTSIGDNKTEAAFKQNAYHVLDEAYYGGIRYFDTAPSYGKGEEFLYQWNKERAHKDVVLGTKWGYTYVADWKIGYQGKHEIKEHSVSKLKEQWEVSKKLLPQLKNYQIHSATLESGVLDNEEVLNHLASLKEGYGIRIGITTSGADQSKVLEKATSIDVDGSPLFDSFQVTYNILESSTHPILRQLIASGKSVIIKEALANGRLFPNNVYKHYHNLYSVLTILSDKYQVGPDAIALRFCMDNLRPEIVLSGASSANHFHDNLKVHNFALLSEDIDLLKTHTVPSISYWGERGDLKWN